MRDAIAFAIGNYFFTTFVLGLIVAMVSIAKKSKPVSKNVKVEAFFSNYILYVIGICNLINFVFHVFLGDTAAEFIGWAQSPFQAEVGFASLGMGIAGIIAYKASLPFRFAAVIPPSIFCLGAAVGHIKQVIVADNFSSGNVGILLPSVIIIPIVGFVLVWLSYKNPKPGASDNKLI